MTRLQKKPLYNFFSFTIFFFLTFITLLLTISNRIDINIFFTVILSSSVAFLILRRTQLNIFRKFRSESESSQEKINLLGEDLKKEKEFLKNIPLRAQKVSFLFDASQKLIEVVEPEEVFQFLIDTARELFPFADDILLFIIKGQSLNLVRSFKKEELVIKEKKGDILDSWVLRHNLSLYVEDLAKDFRFDYNKVIAYKERNTHSFIASPLSIGDKIMGIVRVESKASNSFSLEDSRLLRSICDLGVVVLQKANFFKSVRDLAIRDSLTSLFLREHFISRLEEEIKRALIKKSNLGVIMLDIDNFKKINDTYGHIAGDVVLRKLARILAEIVGDAGNVICRYGGEEFIFFIVECTRDKLFSLGEEIRQKVEKFTISFRRKRINFTVSLGATLSSQDGKNVVELINEVDKLLYQAKREGKNRLCLAKT